MYDYSNLSRLIGQQEPTRMDCVDGLEGARSFLDKMLPSTRHIVWDSQKDTFFVLQKDANNNPARIQICDYTIAYEPSMEEKYVTRDDFNALVSKLDQLLSVKETVTVKEKKNNA